MKNTMKKIVTLTMVLVMALSMLTACGRSSSNEKEIPIVQTEPMQETTAKPETTEAPIPAVLGLNSVVLREEGTVSGVMEATYRLPMLNDAPNLSADFESWVNEAFDYWKHNIDWLSEDGKCDLDFKAAVYRNILSVDLLVNGSTRPFGKNDGIFSVDLETGDELTVEGILSRAGATWEELEEYIREELKLGFAFEDTNYGSIQNIQAFREQELSSENLKNAAVHMSASMNGSIRFGVPQLYYINTESGTPTAKENPVDSCWYVYLNGFSPYAEAITEDASAWVADGEAGTEGTFSYCLPRLTDDRFDTEAFNQWTESCFAEWKDSTKYTSDGLDRSLGYRAFVIGDVLSVMLTNENQYRARIWYTNPSICFSLTTGKRLELKEMMDIAGIPMEQLPDLLADFVESVADSEERIYGSVEGIEEYHKAILSEENLAKTEFVLWPGDLSNTKSSPSDVDDAHCYPAGHMTLRVWIPYQIAEINGVPTLEMRDGYMFNSIQIPGLEIR